MSARSIVVPKFTGEDFRGSHFAGRTKNAFDLLTREGYSHVATVEVKDSAGKVVACTVTGQLTIGGNQDSN